jgi:chromosome segregation ATPase
MTDEELKRLLEASAERIDKRFDIIDKRFTTIDKRFDATDEKIDELRRHVGVTEERWERKFDLLVEGLQNLNEKVDRKASTVAEEHSQAIADTQAMIKFSHAELDRRIRFMEQTLHQLEDGYANLSTRVERLEEIKSNEN